MDVLRTPDSRFENLTGYPFAPHYVDVAASDTEKLRMHYVDEGPPDGQPIVLLHGEPTWSYLYRKMIPLLAEGGHRALAPDLIGFGRSDKPSGTADYTYLRHVEWVTSWFESLDLRGVTLFVQDWGSAIGLRIAAEQTDRIARVVVATSSDDPSVPANRAAWDALGRWDKPFLCVFGARDPLLGRADRPLIRHVPGAKGQPHARINGGHFIQEDCGPELAERILKWESSKR